MCYLDTNDKITCSGCEACANICPHKAICMIPDSEEFRYPKINIDLCTNCGLWSTPPSLKLLWQKYIWGNRQKILFWKLTKGFYHIH